MILAFVYMYALKCLLRNGFLENPPVIAEQKTTASKQKAVFSRQYSQIHLNRYANYKQILSIFALVWVAAD